MHLLIIFFSSFDLRSWIAPPPWFFSLPRGVWIGHPFCDPIFAMPNCFNFRSTGLASVEDDVCRGLYIYSRDCSIACRTILQTPYRGAYIFDIGNGLETDLKRIWNGGGTDLGLGGLFLWQCKVTTISPYKKIHEQLFTHWTMLIEVNQCNVLKDNKISYNVKTYRVTPQKVQYIVNLLYTHPIFLPVFFSIIYI